MAFDSKSAKTYRALSSKDKDKLHALVSYLCEGEDHEAYQETMYAYLNGIADWRADYAKLTSSTQDDQSSN
jgi:hypothetical protein